MPDAPLRRVGRPPLDATSPSVQLGLTMTANTFDALCARASAERTTLAALMRETFERLIASGDAPK